MNFKMLITEYNIANNLKDDIIYCQKSLRHYAKVHQVIVEKIKLEKEIGPSKIIGIEDKLHNGLLELEMEIKQIGTELKALCNTLRERLEDYYNVLEKVNIKIDREYGNIVITKQLMNHYDLCYAKITPFNATRRLTLKQLLNKYLLLTLEEHKEQKAYFKKSKKITLQQQEDKFDKNQLLQINNSKQVSLLKPKAERVGLYPQITTYNNNTNNDDDNNNNNNKSNNNDNNPKIMNETAKSKNVELDLNNIDNSKTIKPATLEIAPKSIAISNSRMNLFKALNKAKNDSLQQQQNQRKQIFKQKEMFNDDDDINDIDDDSNDNSNDVKSSESTAKIKSTTQSPFSSVVSSTASSPVRSEIYEPFETPDLVKEEVISHELLPTDFIQESFLRSFGLYTHEYSQLLQTRRSERRRRNVTSTNRTDFHYGNFDCNYEFKGSKRKKPLLYSPPITRALKRRKQFYDELMPNAGGDNNKQLVTSTTSTASYTQGNKKTCFVCNKNGEDLKSCKKCPNQYHLRCNKNIFNAQLIKARDTLCPICIKKQQNINNNACSQTRDMKLRNRLNAKNINITRNYLSLQEKSSTVQTKLNKQNIIKKHLLNDYLFVNKKMIKLTSFLKQFKN